MKKNLYFSIYAFSILLLTSIRCCSLGGFSGILFFMLALLACIFAPTINKAITNYNCKPPANTSQIKIFITFIFISFLFLLFWFLGGFPGSFSPDSINQYVQVIHGKYNDWHPVLHTLLFFYLPLKIINNIESIVLFQITVFSIFFGYMEYVIYRYAGIKYACISAIFLLLSPFTLNILMHPWKDVAFAMSATMCILYSIHIYQSNNEWTEEKVNLLQLSLMIALSTIFRHNGILFSLPLLVVFYVMLPKKKWLIIFTTSILMIGLIKGPLYSYLDVSKPQERVTETTGFPLSIILNVAKECPTCLDSQTTDFVNRLTLIQPNWKTNHDIVGFNSVKFKNVNTTIIEESGILNIFKMAASCMITAPKPSLLAIFGLTAQVYTLNEEGIIGQGTHPNRYGISWNGISIIYNAETKYTYFLQRCMLTYIFCSIGFCLLLIVSFAIFKLNLKAKSDRKKIFLCIPLFSYTIGTTLLLSGPDIRFFYITYLATPVIILLLSVKRGDSPND